jgi:hypothetical protein
MICASLIDAVDTFDRNLMEDMAGLLVEDLMDSSDCKTFIEQYGLALQRAGDRIDSPFGKVLTMMSRLNGFVECPEFVGQFFLLILIN